MLQYTKAISDPLYGSIPLTQLEIKVIDTLAFQRLRRIGQLGLVHLVFPSATYSRYIHSLGACHVIGEILDKLDPLGAEIRDEERQKYRLAMLLHDMGHLPMSHATEHAAKAFYSERAIETKGTTVEMPSNRKVFVKHEHIGKKVIDIDSEVSKVIGDFCDPAEIGALFNSEGSNLFNSLVSSDLDADRIDYLMRSSQATGLPYGFHDRDFILRNLEVVANPDKEDGTPDRYVCVKEKAVRAADHFLLNRMFDYMQVIYQKTVMGLELALKEVIKGLLREELIQLDIASIEEALASKEWHTWDDAWLLKIIADAVRDKKLDQRETRFAACFLQRRPASLLYQYEVMAEDGGACFEALHQAAFKTGLPTQPLLKEYALTSLVPFRLMEARTRSFADETEDQKQLSKVVRISIEGKPVPIFKVPQSVAGVLGDRVYMIARVYFAGTAEETTAALEQMRQVMEDFKLPGKLIPIDGAPFDEKFLSENSLSYQVGQ